MARKNVIKRDPFYKEILRFGNNFPLAAIGGTIVLFFILVAILAPALAPYDPNQMSLKDALLPPGSPQHLLGTDFGGRDMLSRLMYGARVSLFISCASILVGALLGVFLGIAAAWFEKLQNPIMRFIDIMLSFPSIIIALTIISIMGTGIGNLIFAISIYNIPVFARLTYGQALSVKNLPILRQPWPWV